MNIEKVEVYNKEDIVKIKVNFNEVNLKAKLEEEDFALEDLIDEDLNKEETKEQTENKDNTQNKEENNKLKINKNLKKSNFGKIFGTISIGFVSIITGLTIGAILANSLYFINFIILLVELGVIIKLTKDVYKMNENLKKELNKNSADLDFLEYKINYAKELLEEFKSNSINIEDKYSHKLDINITEIYEDQYRMFDRLSEQAVDIKKAEPLWKAYEADLNCEEIEIAKQARTRTLKQK